MAGGSGTRLWPLSRVDVPKQFLYSGSEDNVSVFAKKAEKHWNFLVSDDNEEHRFLVKEQMEEIGQLSSIITEPEGRNTAPALALAALNIDDDQLLLALPSDHKIDNDKAFARSLTNAIPLALAGKLVTFGILPNRPHTGYGYIRKGQSRLAGYDALMNSLRNHQKRMHQVISSQVIIFGIAEFSFSLRVVTWRSFLSIGQTF